MAREISLYFPHAGRGQTVLIRMDGNSWIVVDAHPVGRRNPAVQILEEHSRQEDFRIVAAVISHLHLDHYLGMPRLFDLGLATGRLEEVILPAPYAFFRGLLQVGARWYVKGAAKSLSDYLQPEGPLARAHVGVTTVRCPALCWRPSEGALRPAEPWIFALHPDADGLLEALGRYFGRDSGEPKNGHESQDWLRRNANDHSTVLSVGHGRADRHLHFLLPADLPGKRFQDLTESIKRKIQGTRPRRAGVNEDLLKVRSSKAKARLRPLCGLAVAHHGSAVDPLRAPDLGWWLADGRKARCPPVAIVQGDRYALGEATVKILAEAGCRIFASALPVRLMEGDLHPPPLKKRNPQPPGRSGDGTAPYTIQSGCQPHPDGAELEACLVVHGGDGGIHAITARNFYEIDVGKKLVIPHAEASWELSCP